jgi:predicted NBD/HSP70 family sugar kinase
MGMAGEVGHISIDPQGRAVWLREPWLCGETCLGDGGFGDGCRLMLGQAYTSKRSTTWRWAAMSGRR